MFMSFRPDVKTAVDSLGQIIQSHLVETTNTATNHRRTPFANYSEFAAGTDQVHNIHQRGTIQSVKAGIRIAVPSRKGMIEELGSRTPLATYKIPFDATISRQISMGAPPTARN
jgi:hypothetical protein